jgi:small subunit ribosomal protein S35
MLHVLRDLLTRLIGRSVHYSRRSSVFLYLPLQKSLITPPYSTVFTANIIFTELSKPFELPPPTHPLRFRHTTYFGENHPAEQKVVLEFTTADLPLTPSQRHCLIKLVGVRYNPQTDVVRLSCEMFEHAAQNKRYLGDLVDTLMQESKEREEEFADIPVDFRHVKWKKRELFPENWKLTEKRKEELEARRKERQDREARLLENGALVDGVNLIEAAVRQAPIQELLRVDAERGTGRGSGSGRGSGRTSSGSGRSGKVERKRVF